jgi:DNA-binding PadR family transcriptional regulator
LLRYGVLGLLIERRGYGYDLVQRLSGRLGAAWQLSPSAVYTALDHLEQDGLIEAVPAPVDGLAAERLQRRAGRVFYQATKSGIAEFRAWLGRPSERVDPIRSQLQLKVALASPDNVGPLLASIGHEEWLILQRLHEEHLAEQPGADDTWPDAARALVEAAARNRLQAELTWLRAVRQALARLAPAHGPSDAIEVTATPSARV